MINKQFKHKAWFIGRTMTVKEFLDYVLRTPDFYIRTKTTLKNNNLFDNPTTEYVLVGSEDNRKYTLDKEDCIYLAEHSEYFKSKFKEAI